MRFNFLKIIFLTLFLIPSNLIFAWEGMPMPKLRVEGRYLKDSHGHIYIVGFWSSGNSPIVIDSVFLSNSSEYDTPVGIGQFSNIKINEPAEVDVYNSMGAKIRSKVKREMATEGLRNGIYFVGRGEVIIYNNF